jgi:hypothetical protein
MSVGELDVRRSERPQIEFRGRLADDAYCQDCRTGKKKPAGRRLAGKGDLNAAGVH